MKHRRRQDCFGSSVLRCVIRVSGSQVFHSTQSHTQRLATGFHPLRAGNLTPGIAAVLPAPLPNATIIAEKALTRKCLSETCLVVFKPGRVLFPTTDISTTWAASYASRRNAPLLDRKLALRAGEVLHETRQRQTADGLRAPRLDAPRLFDADAKAPNACDGVAHENIVRPDPRG